MNRQTYLIPKAAVRVEEKIKKSRFIASVDHAPSVEKAKEFIAEIKKEFSGAAHNCWAYQTGRPGDTSKVGASDDGEPHNTAGKPMLSLLTHFEAGEIVAVVTRYFGGVKLGTGGLVRAYSGVLKKALDALELVEKKEVESISFTIDYENIDAVKNILKKSGAEITEEDYKEKVSFTARVPKEKIENFNLKLKLFIS